MPTFSQFSLDNLSTCHQDVQDLFHEVVKYYDIRIICGHRTVAEQQRLYAKGRTVPGSIVTHCDGILRKSKHQTFPSIACDVVPYPVDWDNVNRFYELAGWVQAFALGMNIPVVWGGHWRSLKDLPHWELRHEQVVENPTDP